MAHRDNLNPASRMILLLVLIVLLVALLPTWGYSSGWGMGYYPSGGLGLIVIIILAAVIIKRPS